MKKFVLIALLMCSVSAAFAQVSVDPNDAFYLKAQAWELKGLTSQLPQLRPYPINVVRRVIEDVIAAGLNEDGTYVARYQDEVVSALQEYERIFSKPYAVMMQGGATYKFKEKRTTENGDTTSSHSGTKQLEGEIAAQGDIVFNRLITMGYHLGLWGTSADYDAIAPEYRNQPQDSVFDASSVGPLDFYLNWNMNLAFGTEQYYTTAGLSRVGYGPFLADGLALNDSAYHAANIMINVLRPRWSFSSVFETIGTTNNLGEDLRDSKYLSFHALRFNLSKAWTVSYYENLTFGPQANVLFMLPAPYMALQNLGGAKANLQMGLLFEFKPTRYWELAADFFVDDLSVNELVKLNFDTKLRVAGQFGMVFTPINSPLSYLTMHYTIVMPYVYAHWEYDANNDGTISGDAWNYQNYTNNGIPIGASIPPDSDKVTFFARFHPKKNVQLDVQTSFVRHQNVAEAYTDDDRGRYMLAKKGTYRTDGSAFTHQMFSDEEASTGDHVDAAWDHLSFMSGAHSMIVCQAGLTAQYTLPQTGKWKIALKAGYTFEFIHNAGVDNDIYPGGLDYTVTEAEDGTKTYTYDGQTYQSWKELYRSDAVQSAADAAYDAWLSELHDKINHYLSLSVKLTY